jgi:uracil-DNA glycosylase
MSVLAHSQTLFFDDVKTIIYVAAIIKWTTYLLLVTYHPGEILKNISHETPEEEEETLLIQSKFSYFFYILFN